MSPGHKRNVRAAPASPVASPSISINNLVKGVSAVARAPACSISSRPRACTEFRKSCHATEFWIRCKCPVCRFAKRVSNHSIASPFSTSTLMVAAAALVRANQCGLSAHKYAVRRNKSGARHGLNGLRSKPVHSAILIELDGGRYPVQSGFKVNVGVYGPVT